VGLVLEGIYRDGTNSIATHAWMGGKLPLFAVKWPIFGLLFKLLVIIIITLIFFIIIIFFF
jgi:hypothetical protein